MPQISYIDVQPLTATTTAQKVVRASKSGKSGYRIAISGSGSVYIKELQTGGTPPTFTTMVTDGVVSWPVMAAGNVAVADARDTIDVYYCCAAGTVTFTFEDLS